MTKAFFTTQFSYYPVIWMFHSRKLNKKNNRLHERCNSDNTSSFKELLESDNFVSVHHRQIQVLGNEMYKLVNA